MEITASSFKLPANAPEGQKAISYQQFPLNCGASRLQCPSVFAQSAEGAKTTKIPKLRTRVLAWASLWLAWLGSVAQGSDVSNPSMAVNVPVPSGPPAALAADREGYALAGSDRFIVIGRPGREVMLDGEIIDGGGQVIVWELEEGFFKRVRTIDAPNPTPIGYFGGAVATSRDWVAVAHGQFRVGLTSNVGGGVNPPNMVQLLEMLEDGTWRVGPNLIPEGEDASFNLPANNFGGALVMVENRLFVTGSSVFVYEEVGGEWNRVQRIDPPNRDRDAGLAPVVAATGDLLMVGAAHSPVVDVDGMARGQGAVFVYRRGLDGRYALETELRLPDGRQNDNFGASIAVETLEDSELAVVGAPLRDTDTVSLIQNAGEIAIYRRLLPAGQWNLETVLTNIHGQYTLDMRAGRSVAVSRNRVAVGSRERNVRFFRYDEGLNDWRRTTTSGPYVDILASFGRGFLMGTHGTGTGSTGRWDWYSTEPYDALLNHPGFFLGHTDSSQRRADADPDGDGIPNSLEGFYGTNPLSPDPPMGLPILHGPSGEFRIQWTQAQNLPGLEVEVTWSGELGVEPWSTNGLVRVHLGTDPGTTRTRHEVRLPGAGKTTVFFRTVIR